MRNAASFFAALFLLEVCARIAGRKDPRKPYLVSLTAGEPMTEFEAAMYDAMDDDR